MKSEHLTLKPGDMLFIYSRIIHRFGTDEETLMPNFLFLPEMIVPASSAVYQEYVLPVVDSQCSYLYFPKEDTNFSRI